MIWDDLYIATITLFIDETLYVQCSSLKTTAYFRLKQHVFKYSRKQQRELKGKFFSV